MNLQQTAQTLPANTKRVLFTARSHSFLHVFYEGYTADMSNVHAPQRRWRESGTDWPAAADARARRQKIARVWSVKDGTVKFYNELFNEWQEYPQEVQDQYQAYIARLIVG